MAFPSVLAAFWKFTGDREGSLNYMYTDRLNLVTTGDGNLIDHGPRNGLDCSPAAMAPALNKPFYIADGSRLASQAEIAAGWKKVKLAGVSQIGGGNQKGIANGLFLKPEYLKALKEAQFASDTVNIRKGFPGYDSMPADGQMLLHSMAWAAGGAFWQGYPKFRAAVNRGDWQTAAVECKMNVNADRQTANEQLALNAAAVLKSGADISKLVWPSSVATAVIAGNAVGGAGMIAVGFGLGAAYLAKKIWG